MRIVAHWRTEWSVRCSPIQIIAIVVICHSRIRVGRFVKTVASRRAVWNINDLIVVIALRLLVASCLGIKMLSTRILACSEWMGPYVSDVPGLPCVDSDDEKLKSSGNRPGLRNRGLHLWAILLRHSFKWC
jgi:hypothetical protein